MHTKEIIEATCPDCRGPLSEHRDEGSREYRCLVGHTYSARTLLQAHSDTEEKALWAAVVALEESANLVERTAGQFPESVLTRLQEQVATKQRQAAEIRRILEKLEVFQTE